VIVLLFGSTPISSANVVTCRAGWQLAGPRTRGVLRVALFADAGSRLRQLDREHLEIARGDEIAAPDLVEALDPR
jgi:hypothetical protein